MRKGTPAYRIIALGIAGMSYAAQVIHSHDPQGSQDPSASGNSAPTSPNTAGSPAAPGQHAGMGREMMGRKMGMANSGQNGEVFAALHRAMQRPIARNLFGAFLLPEMQTELGLSSDQTAQLIRAKQELLAKGDGLAGQIAAKEAELDALFAPDTSKGQQVKTLLEQIAELRAQEHYAIYTAARKMKGMLTDDQRTRLEAMNAEDLHRAAMSHLTLGDLARAMQFLNAGL